MSAINAIYICNVSVWLHNYRYVWIPSWCHWQVSFSIVKKRKGPSSVSWYQMLCFYLHCSSQWLHIYQVTNVFTVIHRHVRKWQEWIFLTQLVPPNSPTKQEEAMWSQAAVESELGLKHLKRTCWFWILIVLCTLSDWDQRRSTSVKCLTFWKSHWFQLQIFSSSFTRFRCVELCYCTWDPFIPTSAPLDVQSELQYNPLRKKINNTSVRFKNKLKIILDGWQTRS